MGEAKILVEVELSKVFPSRIAVGDTTGFIFMVDVEYAWLPTKCSRYGQLGHKIKRYLRYAIAKDCEGSNVIRSSVSPSILVDVTQSPTPTIATCNEVTLTTNIVSPPKECIAPDSLVNAKLPLPYVVQDTAMIVTYTRDCPHIFSLPLYSSTRYSPNGEPTC